MEILGVGPFELLFIIIIMLVVLGPRDMVKTARSLGRFIRKVIRSPMWSTVMSTSREIREIPTRLVRESGLEEDLKTIRRQTNLGDVAGEIMSEMKKVDEEASLQKDLEETFQTETGSMTDMGPIPIHPVEPPQEEKTQE